MEALLTDVRRANQVSITGFTLVELVVVIVIIGILAAVAMPKFVGNSSFEERGYFEELVAALRAAQKTAVATGCPVRVVVDAAGYSVTQQQAASGRCDLSDVSWSVPVQLADGELLAATAPTGVTVSSSVTAIFDALGATNLGANQTLSIGAHTLVLQAASGYVDVP